MKCIGFVGVFPQQIYQYKEYWNRTKNFNVSSPFYTPGTTMEAADQWFFEVQSYYQEQVRR